jgi:predicted secreted protein
MVLAVFIVVASLFAGCVTVVDKPAATKPSQPVPAGNQPPVISNLKAAQTQTAPLGTVQIQCFASDPNNDKLNYVWSATGGKIDGTSTIVTWQAPDKTGTYNISVTVDDGKGASATSSVAIAVGANQNPKIASTVAEPATIGLGGTTLITCIASDPDGDAISYSWQASEGQVSGVGNKITWIAPAKNGSFSINVTVSDSKGGTTQGTAVVNVAGATRTSTFVVVPEETGSVSSDGNRDKSFTKAGDDSKNIGYRAFWSYNIFSLNRMEIKDARLIFTTRNTVGRLFLPTGAESLGGLRLWRVSYADRLPSFDITGSKLDKVIPTITEAPSVVDVTPEIVQLVGAGSTRFQVEALFEKIYNGNDTSEWIEWSDVKLEVTYTEK